MLYFIIELDEEQIKKDGIINLEKAYRCIKETFAQKEVTLHHKEDTVMYYTRNIDYHDFEYLWMVNLPFEDISWFTYYVKIWRFLDIDDETGEVYTDEDLLEEVIRPTKP